MSDYGRGFRPSSRKQKSAPALVGPRASLTMMARLLFVYARLVLKESMCHDASHLSLPSRLCRPCCYSSFNVLNSSVTASTAGGAKGA